MNMNEFKTINEDKLLHIEGGFWGLFLGGTISALDGGGVTLDQLNGGRTRGFKACTCSPYGTGGTPNSCNFC